MIDGYRQISINVSVMEKLKVIQARENLSSFNAVVKYLVAKEGL